jgi:hypothetical protein
MPVHLIVEKEQNSYYITLRAENIKNEKYFTRWDTIRAQTAIIPPPIAKSKAGPKVGRGNYLGGIARYFLFLWIGTAIDEYFPMPDVIFNKRF